MVNIHNTLRQKECCNAYCRVRTCAYKCAMDLKSNALDLSAKYANDVQSISTHYMSRQVANRRHFWRIRNDLPLIYQDDDTTTFSNIYINTKNLNLEDNLCSITSFLRIPKQSGNSLAVTTHTIKICGLLLRNATLPHCGVSGIPMTMIMSEKLIPREREGNKQLILGLSTTHHH